jgi:taurine dioxygenase
MSGIDVRPISGALGAEIHGVQLGGPLDNAAMDQIHRAFLDHLVVFFPDQRLTPDQHKDFARRFGPIYIHPMVEGMKDHPEIIRVVREPGELTNWGSKWHMDGGFAERPPLGTMLHAQEVPPYGSDTMWANLYLAYDALSEGMKRTLEGLRAVHASGAATRYDSKYKGMKSKPAEASQAVHPVVRTHPETGRKCLFVNNDFMVRFDGMTEEESRPVMNYLFEHCIRPEFTCRYRWKAGTLAFWDNRCTQHNAISDYFPGRPELFNSPRIMHRITVEGDRPV